MKQLKLLMAFFAIMVGTFVAASCSDNDDADSNKTYYQFSCENESAVVVDNDQNYTTQTYFAALSQHLADCDGWYDNSEKAQEAVEKALTDFEQNTLPTVYYYGQFAVNYTLKGSTQAVKLANYVTHKTLSKAALYKAVGAIAAANPDGFTVDAETLMPVTKGFAVAVEDTQDSFGTEGLATVVNYVTSHSNVNAYGGWLNSDNNQYYYDATVICSTREEAEALAKLNHQIAYFDLENMEEIRL